MTEEEVKRFLNRPSELENEIHKQRRLLEELNTRLLPSGIDYSKDKVQTSPEDSFSKICTMIREKEKHIHDLEDERYQAILDVDKKIEKLDNADERVVLYCFHVLGESEDSVASAVGYTVRQMYRIKESAIRNLAKLM